MNNRIAAACGVAVLLAGTTACGGGNDDASTPTSAKTSGLQADQVAPAQLPGANGKVAAVDGSTAQVQSQQNGQVAVTWNGSTTFTQEVAASLADVEVGDCVAAMPDQDSAGSSADDDAVAAATVRITATSGDCAPGAGGGPRPQFDGPPPSGAPNSAPSDLPSDAPRQLRGSFGAVGKVTAVSGAGFTVSAVRPGTDGSSDTTTVTVTTTKSTTFTRNAPAKASDVTVGRCLAAQGTTDDTGAVTARTVALSSPVDGECGGLLRFRGTGPGGPGGSGQAL